MQHRIVRFVFLKRYFNISAENEQKVDKDGNKKIDSQSITIVSGQRNLSTANAKIQQVHQAVSEQCTEKSGLIMS